MIPELMEDFAQMIEKYQMMPTKIKVDGHGRILNERDFINVLKLTYLVLEDGDQDKLAKAIEVHFIGPALNPETFNHNREVEKENRI